MLFVLSSFTPHLHSSFRAQDKLQHSPITGDDNRKWTTLQKMIRGSEICTKMHSDVDPVTGKGRRVPKNVDWLEV